MKYNYVIVGAGLFGAVFAHEAVIKGYSCLVIDKRNHIGGNCYCESVEGINVHKYGAHIFHTSDEEVWQYVNELVRFNNYVNSPIAMYKDEIYNLPFNMNTFSRMWNIKTPEEAKMIIERQKTAASINKPKSLEEQAISLVGTDIYEKLVKHYTEKQWGRPCSELPADIIKRLPCRFTYNNNYFNDRYQGIPIGGYNGLFTKLLEGCDVMLGCSWEEFKSKNDIEYDKLLFTGPIDEYYNYKEGKLEFRSVKFDTEVLDCENFQGNAVINYTDDTPYTRIIEHKHFEFGTQPKTVISKEYPIEYTDGVEPYYPINNSRNTEILNRYLELAKAEYNVIFGGRLGSYKYLDMDKTIREALNLANKEL